MTKRDRLELDRIRDFGKERILELVVRTVRSKLRRQTFERFRDRSVDRVVPKLRAARLPHAQRRLSTRFTQPKLGVSFLAPHADDAHHVRRQFFFGRKNLTSLTIVREEFANILADSFLYITQHRKE